ncbi:MAG TPA: ABC transporter ATP-binding protein [Alphaproteobacteria bacterium]|jgi:NitT/TauT family transport system ATP-binding protein
MPMRPQGRQAAVRTSTGAAADAASVVLEVDRVEKVFGRDAEAVRALAPTSFEVRAGEFVAIIGPSGCGKSTLFNIIGGLEPATAGEVRIDGRKVSGSHRDIGMVFQEESTFPWRTVLDNVAFGLEVAGMSRAERHEKARKLIRMVGLEGFERRMPAELSGGMRQRTAIARTLASEPRILLLDEPFASLDEQTRMLLGEQLIEICGALNQTTLLITHNISEAVQLSDRVAVMSFRPGTIKRFIEIDLPRPRTTEVIGSAIFGRYVQQIWEELKAEALRGMQAAQR